MNEEVVTARDIKCSVKLHYRTQMASERITFKLGIESPEVLSIVQALAHRHFHVSAAANKSQSGRYKVTLKRDRPLTYEMANPPHYIAHRKSWNSWNTSNIEDGNRPSEMAIEDMFIRQFMNGTWHNLFASEVIIKRQHNIIRIAGIITRTIAVPKIYFLIGYTEELLSYWLQCPIKIELVTTDSKKDVIFKYI